VIYLTFLVIFGFQNYNSETTLISIQTIVWFNHILALTIGIPAFFILRAKGLESLKNYAIGGLLICLLLIALISNNFVYIFYIMFSIAGSLMGVMFWYIALYKPVRSLKRSRRSRRRTR
jgi:hypothetical protein